MRVFLCACALAALTAQTPAPAPSPVKPLRHLEYAFSVAAQSPQSSKAGTMYVDVLSVATDGALSVRISELVQGDPRPGPAYTCSVYGNTSVLCPSTPAPSEAGWVLLAYLGRQFVDGAPWDAHGHWQRTESSAQFEIQEDFTLVDVRGANKAIVREVKKLQLHNGGFDSQTSDVTVTYDRSMEVPVVVRDEVATAGGAAAGGAAATHASYQFTLERDSFAKPGR